jgi:Ni,Fe-hydrogenase I small subunit
MTQAVCNADLWNGVSSKTRAGVPCFGCTSPTFPRDGDLFRTEKMGEVPIRLPLGWSGRATWLTRTWPVRRRRNGCATRR